MQGHIRKRGRGSWAVVVELGRDPLTGGRRQQWRSVKGTKRDAEALLVQLLSQRDTGVDAPPGKLSVGAYLAYWLEHYARANVAPSTFLQYEWAIRRHLTPALGSVPLTKLRPQHVQNFYADAIRRGRADGTGGLSAKTVLHLHRLLREALHHAQRWQMLTLNPADAATPPRAERHDPAALSPEAVRRLLDTADETPYGALVHTAVMTGMRRGELQGLRWQDVDMDGALIHVRQAAQWLPRQGWAFRAPKTPRSRRPVALAPVTVQVLKGHRRAQTEARLALGPAYADYDLVFATPIGTPIDPSNLRRAWKGIAESSGLGYLRLHDTRHICASLMLLQGVNPKVVSERLGHASVSLTLDRYSATLPSLQAQAAEGLERLLAVGERR